MNEGYKYAQNVCRRTCSRYVYGQGHCRVHGQNFYKWGELEEPCPDFRQCHRKQSKPKVKAAFSDSRQINLFERNKS